MGGNIKYDSKIKIPNEVHEYTEEQIRELQKCSSDAVYFIENYIKIVHQDHGIIPFVMFPFQREMLQTLNDNRFSILMSSRQSGKCVYEDTKVNLRNKMTGETMSISVGDFYESIK